MMIRLLLTTAALLLLSGLTMIIFSKSRLQNTIGLIGALAGLFLLLIWFFAFSTLRPD